MRKITLLLSLFLISWCIACNQQSTEQAQVGTDSTSQVMEQAEEPTTPTSTDSLDGFGIGEFVATQISENSWYLGKITGFENGQVNLVFVDNDTATKPSTELVKLEDTLQVAVGDNVYALFGDGIRFREATIKEIIQDSLLVSFDGYEDDRVHRSRVFKK